MVEVVCSNSKVYPGSKPFRQEPLLTLYNLKLYDTIIIIAFIQYMKQVKNYKSHKNRLLKPGKKIN